MNIILTKLHDLFLASTPNPGLERLVENNHKRLMRTLGKTERRLVLEIIDAKDQIAENASIDGFAAGFELACRLCGELSHVQNSVTS